MQIFAIEILKNHLYDISPPETIMLQKMRAINLQESLEAVLDIVVIRKV